MHQRRKRAKALRVFVRVSRARSVEARRAGFLLHRFDLVRRHKNEFSLWIEKAPDEPTGCRAVNLNSFPGNPLHSTSSVSRFAPCLISNALTSKLEQPYIGFPLPSRRERRTPHRS